MPTSAEKELSDRIAREFAAELRQRLGDSVHKIILFGSRARGLFTEGEEFKFVVTVDHKDREIDGQILDFEGEYLDRYDLLFSSQVMTEDIWEIEQRGMWGGAIKMEGIRL
jgi:predicted nucleotidyltransferase